MLINKAFADELIKIAKYTAHYKEMRVGNENVFIRENVPTINKLPTDVSKMLKKIDNRLMREQKTTKSRILGHANVAVRKEAIPELESIGFKPTRISVPLPGEKVFNTSWRRGKLHVHEQGPMYFIHKDTHAPKGVLSTTKHLVTEGVPATIRRLRDRSGVIMDITNKKFKELKKEVQQAELKR
ncbi:MAG: hypothetical protein ACXAEU_17060 [Candidatus Hodarchaeales archaeon]